MSEQKREPLESPAAKLMIRVVAAEVERAGDFLLTQRRPQASFPLFWEFPSGRVEEGERDEEALKRELSERLGVEAEVGDCTMFVKQEYDDYILDFYVYRCVIPEAAEIKALKVNDWRWVNPQEMESYPFPPADAHSIKRILDEAAGLESESEPEPEPEPEPSAD